MKLFGIQSILKNTTCVQYVIIFPQTSIVSVEWSEGKTSQTETLTDDENLEVPVVLPDKSDMFVAYATVPGYRSAVFQNALN